MKRILFLGAGPLTLPAIEHALERGHTVLTTDNLPRNPGHRLAHRAFEVSTTEVDAVHALAVAESVDGVIGFASEVSALTAAVVAERLNLPGPGVEGALRLTHKDRFREWSSGSGIQPLPHAAFDREEMESAARWSESLGRPVVVKPTDNSGSRGVTVDPGTGARFAEAFREAAAYSRRGRVLVEELVEREGPQICGDGFVENGELVYAAFGDNRSLADSGRAAIFQETYPSSHSGESLGRVRRRLEDLVRESGFRRGPINFDAIIRPGGEPHVFEIGIRSGGNLIPVALGLLDGVDLVGAAVDSAIAPDFRLSAPAVDDAADPRFLITHVAHSREEGILKRLRVSDAVERAAVRSIPFRVPGDPVFPFRASGDAVAVLLLSFSSRGEMLSMASRLPRECVVELEPRPSR